MREIFTFLSVNYETSLLYLKNDFELLNNLRDFNKNCQIEGQVDNLSHQKWFNERMKILDIIIEQK